MCNRMRTSASVENYFNVCDLTFRKKKSLFAPISFNQISFLTYIRDSSLKQTIPLSLSIISTFFVFYLSSRNFVVIIVIKRNAVCFYRFVGWLFGTMDHNTLKPILRLSTFDFSHKSVTSKKKEKCVSLYSRIILCTEIDAIFARVERLIKQLKSTR